MNFIPGRGEPLVLSDCLRGGGGTVVGGEGVHGAQTCMGVAFSKLKVTAL